MSILLDALRKSENSQKPVEPPTINSNDHPMAEPESMKAGLLAVLLIVALLLIGWLVWRQYQPEIVTYRPPVDLPEGKSSPAEPAVVSSDQVQKEQVPPQTTSSGTTRPRTPVETYEPSAGEKLAAKRKQQRDNVIAAKAAQADQTRASKPAWAPATLPAETALQKPLTNDPEQTGQTVQEQPYQSPEPQPIGYWDLPDSVRNGVPVIKFSVLVFADAPADRFVLINGSRLVEGDELKPGLVLEQIRREGAVFSYQLYRFFVKR